SGFQNENFELLAVELFALQFKHNPAYRRICEERRAGPGIIRHWTQVPFVPAGAFKELEMSGIPAPGRTTVFHSSGTTGQTPSRHFHSDESLAVYEESLWRWFERNVMPDCALVILTPPASLVPRSSLAYMFEIIRLKIDGVTIPTSRNVFFGKVADDGAWVLDFDALLRILSPRPHRSSRPTLMLGTAFSFVHLVDFLTEKDLRMKLPAGSWIMETGG